MSHCIDKNEVHYNPIPHDYSKDYLTFEVVEGGTITIKATDASVAKTISYKVNDGEWSPLTTSTTIQTLGGTLNVGDKVLVKGNNTTYGAASYYNTFGGTAKVNVYGNIMSLISGDNFSDSHRLSERYTFNSLLYGYANLLSAENLVLSATALADNCYQGMFYNCTKLTTAPELPATTLVSGCYNDMFRYCTNLTTAPELPATTLAKYCYQSMFSNCTSLTTAPELPATTLVRGCYEDMFKGCTKLTTAPELPATKLADNCYDSMFQYCTSLVNAPQLPATTLAESCYRSMFQDCTSLVNAPELPVMTLTDSCYYYMFSGCKSLTTAPELPATTLVYYCYRYMFQDCGKLNYIKAMFTTTPSTDYTNNWVSGVAATGTFVKNSAATWNVSGNNGIPTGWTVETATA